MSYYSCTIYSRQVSQVFVRPVDYGHLAAAAAVSSSQSQVEGSVGVRTRRASSPSYPNVLLIILYPTLALSINQPCVPDTVS